MNNVDSKENKNKVLIVVLVLVILCLGGFLIYEKIIPKNNNLVLDKIDADKPYVYTKEKISVSILI